MQQANSLGAQQTVLGTESGLLPIWAFQAQLSGLMATECS